MDHQTKTNIIAHAEQLFSEKNNCCESVVLAVTNHYGVSSSIIRKIATPFGGGIGGAKDACGAFLGGVMAIGAVLGRQSAAEVDRKWAVGEVAANYRQMFLEKIGTTNCGEIRGDRPDDTLNDTVCGEAVREATGAAVDVIEEALEKGL